MLFVTNNASLTHRWRVHCFLNDAMCVVPHRCDFRAVAGPKFEFLHSHWLLQLLVCGSTRRLNFGAIPSGLHGLIGFSAIVLAW